MPTDEQRTPQRKHGAQPGNKNAVGAGAPKGSANAAVTGAYMKIYGELLTDEEKEIVKELLDPDTMRRASLLQLLASLRIRERRLLSDINDVRDGAEMLTRRTLSQIEPSGKRSADGREMTKVVKISQEQENRRELVQRFEDALTRIQAEIRRTEDSIRQLDDSEIKNTSLAESVRAIDTAEHLLSLFTKLEGIADGKDA